VPARHLDVAVRAHHEKVGVRHLAGEESQQEQRGLVGPVEIVEDEHQRPGLGAALQERRDRIEQAKARLLGVDRRRSGEVGKAIVNLGNDLRHIRHGGAEDLFQHATVALVELDAKDLRPGPVGRRALALPGAAPEDGGVAGRGALRQLVGELALADARLAGNQNDRAAAGDGALEPVVQRGELRLAADEDALGGLGHGRR
jgi:hypothetical protein